MISKLPKQVVQTICSVIKESGGLDIFKYLVVHASFDVRLQILEIISQFFPSNDDEVLWFDIINLLSLKNWKRIH